MGYYKVTISFSTDEIKKNGDPKVIVENWIIEADSTEEANTKVYNKLKDEGTVSDVEVTGVVKQKIDSVILRPKDN